MYVSVVEVWHENDGYVSVKAATSDTMEEAASTLPHFVKVCAGISSAICYGIHKTKKSHNEIISLAFKYNSVTLPHKYEQGYWAKQFIKELLNDH